MTYTKGPWRAVNCDVHPTAENDGRRLIDIRAGDVMKSPCADYVKGYIDCGGDQVAWCCSGSYEDARLIAAAPELVEALREVLGWHDDADNLHKPIEVRAAYMRARALLAKIDGDEA